MSKHIERFRFFLRKWLGLEETDNSIRHILDNLEQLPDMKKGILYEKLREKVEDVPQTMYGAKL